MPVSLLTSVSASIVASVLPFSYSSILTVGILPEPGWFLTQILNSCKPAPTVGLPVGVGKLTRVTVSTPAVIAVSQLASELSGSSSISVTAPDRLSCCKSASGLCLSAAARATLRSTDSLPEVSMVTLYGTRACSVTTTSTTARFIALCQLSFFIFRNIFLQLSLIPIFLPPISYFLTAR